MIHQLHTRVEYKPRDSEDQTHAYHRGTVIYHTTDDFYRVEWDEPNPDPSFFNLERIFRYECLKPIEE
jgi:hypothetical protein